MTTDSLKRYSAAIKAAMAEVPASSGITAAAVATALVGIEAYRNVRFEDLPARLIEQLRGDGTDDGPLRSLEEARALFERRVPAEAKGSTEGVESVVSDPGLDAMHIEPYADGGSNGAENIVYGPEGLSSQIGDRPMTESEIAEAEAFSFEVAEQATPGVTGDLGEVIGDSLETGAFSGVFGGGMAVAHRWAQAQGFRDAGRHDLAEAAQEQMVEAGHARRSIGVIEGFGGCAGQGGATQSYSSQVWVRLGLMTVKSSISLRDDQHAFAKNLVESGRFPSVSAVVQQGLDLLRAQDADSQADRAALKALLSERAGGPFVSADALRARLAARRA